jgi:G protein beta subunit-like protein
VVLATASYDHKIRFWEASKEKCTRILRYPDSQVNALAITNDKQYIAAVGHQHAKIFAVHQGDGNPVRSYDAHSGNVTAVGFQSDAKWMYTASEDKFIRIWDLRAPRCQRQYECPAGVNSVALHPNQSEIVSGDQAGNIRFWDLQSNTCSQELSPKDYDCPIEFGSELLTNQNNEGGDGGNETPSPPPPPSSSSSEGPTSSFVPRHGGDAGGGAVRSVTMASDGSVVAAVNHAGRMFTWTPRSDGSGTGYVRKTVTNTNHNGYLLKCVLSPDCSKLVTCSSDKTAKIWSMSDHPRSVVMEKTLAQHQRWVWDACFSADSAYLLTASSDNTAKLWDVNSGEVIRHYTSTMAVTCVALNDSQ